jgi:hypothetical protein
MHILRNLSSLLVLAAAFLRPIAMAQAVAAEIKFEFIANLIVL